MSYLKFGGVLIVMLSLICGTHYYLARRIDDCVRHFFPALHPMCVTVLLIFFTVMMLLSVARPLSGVPQRLLSAIGACWMGMFAYLLLFLLAADLVCLPARLLFAVPQKMYLAVRLTAIALALVTVVYGFFHANRIHTVHYDIQLAEQPSSQMRVVMLSDLHLGAVNSEARLKKIVAGIEEQNPDLVCIAGDIFDNDYSAILNPDGMIDALRQISAVHGVYACPGNHDAGAGFAQMGEFLERASIRLLKDEFVVIGERLILVGRLDPSPIGGYGGEKRKALSAVLAGAAPGLPVVVLDHNPIDAKNYRGEADLVLSGHTHKGQIFPGSLITDAMYAVDYGYLRTETGTRIIVSSGAGTWGPPIRVGSDCEIVSIDLEF